MPRTICILDDDPVSARLASGALVSHHAVAVFHDVEGARQHLHAARPDILVLDLQLPGFNGVEVLEWARELNPFLRVVAVTGDAPVTSILACWRLGADACVLKGEHFGSKLRDAVAKAEAALEGWEDCIAAMRSRQRAAAAALAGLPSGGAA